MLVLASLVPVAAIPGALVTSATMLAPERTCISLATWETVVAATPEWSSGDEIVRGGRKIDAYFQSRKEGSYTTTQHVIRGIFGLSHLSLFRPFYRIILSVLRSCFLCCEVDQLLTPQLFNIFFGTLCMFNDRKLNAYIDDTNILKVTSSYLTLAMQASQS